MSVLVHWRILFRLIGQLDLRGGGAMVSLVGSRRNHCWRDLLLLMVFGTWIGLSGGSGMTVMKGEWGRRASVDLMGLGMLRINTGTIIILKRFRRT